MTATIVKTNGEWVILDGVDRIERIERGTYPTIRIKKGPCISAIYDVTCISKLMINDKEIFV